MLDASMHIFRQLAHANTSIVQLSTPDAQLHTHVQYYSMHPVVHYHSIRLAPKNVYIRLVIIIVGVSY